VVVKKVPNQMLPGSTQKREKKAETGGKKKTTKNSRGGGWCQVLGE